MQARVVGSTCQVPGLDVFLHARGEARLLLGAQARPGNWDAVLKAVLVHFLDEEFGVLDRGLERDGVLDLLADFRGW